MEQKYWIHVFPNENGYLHKQWGRFDLGKKGDNGDDFTIAWTSDEIDELQKKVPHINLKGCMEPVEVADYVN